MRLCSILIQYFFLIYFCYCHDLNHADPVTIKPSESSVTTEPPSKTTETTTVQKNENENTRFQAIHDLRKPNHINEEQVQYTTPSVDISLQKQVPVSIQNDLTSPSTPVQQSIPTVSDTIKNIPNLNEPKPTQINSQPIDTIQQNRLEEDETESHQQEQIKPISDHIPSPSNSNLFDLKSDQESQVPIKPTETITNDTSVVQDESHSSRILRSSTSRHPRDIQTTQQSVTIENKTQPNSENSKPVNNTDLPNSTTSLNSSVDSNKSENLTINKEIENATIVPSFPINDTNAHLPRILENEENESVINSSNSTNETTQYFAQIESKIEEGNNSIISNSTSILNNTDRISTNKNRQICWHLPKKFESSIELLENQIFRLINTLPEFLQTIVFGRIEDREILMNTIWFSSICTMCFFFSFLCLLMGTKRLKQSKQEKLVRTRCQQLQQYNNQIELERSTFERQNQKLSDEIDELKIVPLRDTDEDIYTLRKECIQFQEDIKTSRIERDILQQDIDYKQNLIQKYEYDMKGQMEIVTHLNNQILHFKQELDKERGIVIRLQSNDLSLERFEKSQEIIQELKSEITQLKQENFTQKDHIQEIQEHNKQLDIENNQLVLRMKQLKDLCEQYDQTIKRFDAKLKTTDHFEVEDLLSILTDKSSNNHQDFLSIIDNDIQKSNQHIHHLHHEIEEKTRRIKELDLLFKQEKDHCKEIETKLKIILELRERDTHLHIRQLGQTDAELRKAKTDTDRVRILQQQLELKQQQLDDIQKVLSSEQSKFNEECSKLQHETHEKWMEVKRLTREFDASKKECEGLRRQITKYANNERLLQEKTMNKSVAQHFGESETNSSSPISYQQGEHFRSIDYQRNDSGATSPAEMFIPRPPLYSLPRPPFFPSQFMPHPPPPPNSFMMHPRFPMPTVGPHGMISPISHLITNGNDANNSGIIDSSNSTSYDTQSNGVVASPIPDDENQIKTKKPKKSLKKKTRTSAVKENV